MSSPNANFLALFSRKKRDADDSVALAHHAGGSDLRGKGLKPIVHTYNGSPGSPGAGGPGRSGSPGVGTSFTSGVGSGLSALGGWPGLGGDAARAPPKKPPAGGRLGMPGEGIPKDLFPVLVDPDLGALEPAARERREPPSAR